MFCGHRIGGPLSGYGFGLFGALCMGGGTCNDDSGAGTGCRLWREGWPSFSWPSFLCPDVRDDDHMTELNLRRAGIDDDEIARNQPVVRAELHRRLEDLYAACEPHIDGTAGKPDPRMLELGLRVVKEQADLWKLGHLVQAAPAEAEVTPREVALAKAKQDLLELEARAS